jgi:hypothetical protein
MMTTSSPPGRESMQGNEDEDDRYAYPSSFRVLGFDPFKEVIFLTTLDVAVAYHLGTSKVQFLGILKPSTACMIRLCIHRVPPCVIADEYIRSASRSDISCVRQAASCMFLLWLEDLVYFLLTFVICLEPNQNN